MRTIFIPLGILAFTLTMCAADETNSTFGVPPDYVPLPALEPTRHVLRRGDRLAICGDSITEQKMYSRIIEDYLTMCVPQLDVTVRQYGWSGERAPGFLSRMTNDCLRFKPTIATTCYGMNDHQYRAYTDSIGQTYRMYSDDIVRAFKAHGVRVILGAAGCVGKVPSWHQGTNSTVADLNLNLGTLRNIDVELAKSEKVGFADVYWPLLNGGVAAHEKYGAGYNICGRDGVHPGWAGHTVMAYAFLKAMGLNGDIGTITVDLKKSRMKTTKGHEVVFAKDGQFEIKSSRYPFCACEPAAVATNGYPNCASDDTSKDSSIQSGMTLVPFNQELNRLTLIVKNGSAPQYQVTWGADSKTFSAAQLEQGINLAAEFPNNPFDQAFAKVDGAVIAKQAFETREIKQSFRPPGVRNPSPEQLAAQTERVIGDDEKQHAELAAVIRKAFVPVTHVIKISPQ